MLKHRQRNNPREPVKLNYLTNMWYNFKKYSITDSRGNMDIQITHNFRRIATLFVCAFLAMLISSCDGSSSSDGDVLDDDGVVSGTVVDAITGAPLNGVEVSLEDDPSVTTFSSPDGSWRIGPVRASEDSIRFASPGFRRELMRRPSLGDPILPVQLIPDDNAGNGGLTGAVTNLNGELLIGALLQFIEGINITDGPIVGTTTTGADGSYIIPDLPYGNYTCIVIIDGVEPFIQIVQVLGNITQTEQDVVIPTNSVLPPVQPLDSIGPDDVRIELSWNAFADLRHVLVNTDGSEITRDSPEFNSGEIALIEASDPLPRTSSITLPRSVLEGRSYSVFSESFFFGGIGGSISLVRPMVSVLDQTGTLAEFVPAETESLTSRWDVFSFVNGQPVEIVN